MKEEIARLQTQVIQLKNKKRRSIVAQMGEPKSPISTVTTVATTALSTPPESPCNSYSSSDLFDELNKVDQNFNEDNQVNGGGVVTEDWVTVTKRNSNRRSRSSLRGNKTSSRGRRVSFVFIFTQISKK
jgi:hypothetical protein